MSHQRRLTSKYKHKSDCNNNNNDEKTLLDASNDVGLEQSHRANINASAMTDEATINDDTRVSMYINSTDKSVDMTSDLTSSSYNRHNIVTSVGSHQNVMSTTTFPINDDITFNYCDYTFSEPLFGIGEDLTDIPLPPLPYSEPLDTSPTDVIHSPLVGIIHDSRSSISSSTSINSTADLPRKGRAKWQNDPYLREKYSKFMCPYCKRLFKNGNGLRYHVKQSVCPESKLFVQMARSFSSSSSAQVWNRNGDGNRYRNIERKDDEP